MPTRPVRIVTDPACDPHVLTNALAAVQDQHEQIAAMQPVIVAAIAWRDSAIDHPDEWADGSDKDLIAAIDTYRQADHG